MAIIFIVDDSPTACNKIAKTLSPRFTCFQYTSASSALLEMEEHKPSIVLLDINMPEIDGYEACKRIKKQHSELSPLIIFVSGVDTLEQRLLAYDVGGHDFITKPFSEEELLKKIDNIAQLVSEKASLIESENQSKSLVMTTMKQASQYSYIMGFFKNLQHCPSYDELTRLFFGAMEHFNLHASLMIAGDPDRFFSSPTNFEITPIEKSIYETIHEMGRLYEFGQRMMVNDKHVSFLVKNMPKNEEDA